jgi:hypothetical protein
MEEQHFGVRLDFPETLEEEDIDALDKAVMVDRGKEIKINSMTLTLELASGFSVDKTKLNGEFSIRVANSQPDMIDLLGQQITLGYGVVNASDAVFEDPKAIEQALLNGETEITAVVVSQSGSLMFQYEPELPIWFECDH